MPICPHCGSYSSEGSTVCSCGAPFVLFEERDEEKQPPESPFLVTAREYNRRALHFQNQGDYQRALEFFDKAIEEYPGYFKNSIKADAYFGAGMYEEALESYKSRLSKNDSRNNYKEYQDIAKTLDALCRFDEAVETYSKAIDMVNMEYDRLADFYRKDKMMSLDERKRGFERSGKDRNTRNSKICENIAWSYTLRGDYFDYDEKISAEHYKTALRYIDMSLKVEESAVSWNTKAIILQCLKRYWESKQAFDRSLELERTDKVIKNKAGMIREWCEMTIDVNGDFDYALKLLDEATGELEAASADENLDEYMILKEKIQNKRVKNENHKILKDIGKDNLITIAGSSFYHFREFEKGMVFNLVREPENAFDGDAIAVCLDGEKVGYVANSASTYCVLTSKASQIRDIPENSRARYLMCYDNYHIAQIISQ